MSGRRPRIAPVVLGCCREEPRCALCAPAPSPVAPDAISALIDTVEAANGAACNVGFYGGPPPTPEQLAAADGRPVGVRVRPDLLSRAEAKRLVDNGVTSIELDVLTLDNRALHTVGRTYRRALVLEQIHGLGAMGIEVGVVVAPGLPGSNYESAMADARDLAPLVQTARIHPVLVLRHSGLYSSLLDGMYTPLTLAEAVTVCQGMVGCFEAHQCRVIRMGQQGGPDGIGIVAAGPAHPSLRELVEARRTLERVRSVLQDSSWVDPTTSGGHVVLRCAPADISRARGPLNQHVRTLRAEYGLDALTIEADPTLPRGQFRVNEKSR